MTKLQKNQEMLKGSNSLISDIVSNALKTPKNPAYNFTLEELDELSLLSGKEKKLFLKKLKEKYNGFQSN